MLACYGPGIVMVFLLQFGNIDHSIEIRIADEFSLCLVFLNSSLNPVLYCWRIKDVRREVQNTIRKCLCCWVDLQWWRKDATEQHPQWEDNWLATNSAAMLIPANTTYTERTHIVHRISYPCILIFFCLNRVMKDVWQCLRRLRRAKRTLIKNSVDFGCGHIGFF